MPPQTSSNIRLKMLGLPVIQSLDDFAIQTHLSKYIIYQLSNHADCYYKTYEIPKKSGKSRIINQPSRKLKGLQAWILYYILDKLKVSSSSKGFEKKTSILSNVEPHRYANTILCIDIEDFFPSINREQVYSVFKSIGYNKLIATILTNLCTVNNQLPQGGPCSPKLANLILWNLDIRIQGYVGKRGITYTRYADDLTFSGVNPNRLAKILPKVREIIEDEKFRLNVAKTRIAGLSRAKIVTGLVISNENYGIGRKRFNEIRSKIYHLTKSKEQENTALLYHVNGWLSYIYSVDKPRYQKSISYIKNLQLKFPNTLVKEINVR